MVNDIKNVAIYENSLGVHLGINDITPWQPGQSGNPAGKPKGTRNRSTIVRRWLEAKGKLEGLNVADELVLALIEKASQGDVNAFKELFDSGYGKLTEKTQLSGDPDGNNPVFEFVVRHVAAPKIEDK